MKELKTFIYIYKSIYLRTILHFFTYLLYIFLFLSSIFYILFLLVNSYVYNAKKFLILRCFFVIQDTLPYKLIEDECKVVTVSATNKGYTFF